MWLTFLSGIITGVTAVIAYQQGGLLMFAGGWVTGVVVICLLSKWIAEKKLRELGKMIEEGNHD